MADDQDDGYTPVEYLFKGVRLNWNGEPRAHLQLVTGNPDGDSLFDWKAKTFSGLTVGGVYTIDVLVKEGGARTFRLGTAKFVRLWEDRLEREGMQAIHRSALASLDRMKRRDKAAKEDARLTHSLAPLRAQYAKCATSSQRVAFELYVLDCLRKG